MTSIFHITGSLLRDMMYSAYQRLAESTDYLNAINVFPVADGDTGHNMRSTMGKIIEELKKKAHNLSIKDASKAIKKGAFIGAKGNSGVILSQFFVGFAKIIENEEVISPQVFAEAFVEGSKKAQKAVMNPREGTILTVVRETANTAKAMATDGASWNDIVEACYEQAQEATLNTPNLMEELKKAGVVDSGALGFVYLIQGWLFVISTHFQGPKVMEIRSGLTDLHRDMEISHQHENLNYRYCTEGYITKITSSPDEIRDQFENYGDSLILIEDDNEMKLHIHCNEPSKVLNEFGSYGKIRFVKIDDMANQFKTTHS